MVPTLRYCTRLSSVVSKIKIRTNYPIFRLIRVRVNRSSLYIFCHLLGWRIRTCTSYPIVLLIRVRINENRLYIDILILIRN